MTMLEGVRDHLVVPILVKHASEPDGAGDRVYSDPVKMMCYPEHKTRVVTNKYGQEVTSSTALYMAPEEEISTEDLVSLVGEYRRAVATNAFYNLQGTVSVRVVYF